MRIRSSTDYQLRYGFTLVEAIVAIGAGAFMLTALYSGLTFGFATVKLAREDLRATQIMLQRVETLRLSNFAAIQTGTFTDYFDPTGATNASSGAMYTITIKIGRAHV